MAMPRRSICSDMAMARCFTSFSAEARSGKSTRANKPSIFAWVLAGIAQEERIVVLQPKLIVVPPFYRPVQKLRQFFRTPLYVGLEVTSICLRLRRAMHESDS